MTGVDVRLSLEVRPRAYSLWSTGSRYLSIFYLGPNWDRSFGFKYILCRYLDPSGEELSPMTFLNSYAARPQSQSSTPYSGLPGTCFPRSFGSSKRLMQKTRWGEGEREGGVAQKTKKPQGPFAARSRREG